MHAGVHLGQEVLVACVHVVVVYTQEPEEGVVHNGIGVTGHGVFAAQQPNGAFHRLIVEEEVVIHQVALYGIATPNPSVTFDAVNEELAGGEVHGICAYIPDAVYFFVVATEAAPVFFGHVLILHVHRTVVSTFATGDVHVTESFAALYGIAALCCTTVRRGKVGHHAVVYAQAIECFAIGGILCFFGTLSVVNVHCAASLKGVQRDVAEGFFTEIDQFTSLNVFACGGWFCFNGKAVGGWQLRGVIEVPAACIEVNGSRCIAGFSTLVNPFFVFEGYFPRSVAVHRSAFYKQGRWCALVVHFDVEVVLSGRKQ